MSSVRILSNEDWDALVVLSLWHHTVLIVFFTGTSIEDIERFFMAPFPTICGPACFASLSRETGRKLSFHWILRR